jgi:hypothetical protein
MANSQQQSLKGLGVVTRLSTASALWIGNLPAARNMTEQNRSTFFVPDLALLAKFYNDGGTALRWSR